MHLIVKFYMDCRPKDGGSRSKGKLPGSGKSVYAGGVQQVQLVMRNTYCLHALT